MLSDGQWVVYDCTIRLTFCCYEWVSEAHPSQWAELWSGTKPLPSFLHWSHKREHKVWFLCGQQILWWSEHPYLDRSTLYKRLVVLGEQGTFGEPGQSVLMPCLIFSFWGPSTRYWCGREQTLHGENELCLLQQKSKLNELLMHQYLLQWMLVTMKFSVFLLFRLILWW